MQPNHVSLVDEYGQPLNARLQGALATLAPRLQRQFPTLNDDCAVTEVLEEAGRRIQAREERQGPLDQLHSYAWVVVKRMAALRLRHDEWAVASATLASDESTTAFDGLPSRIGTAEQIEARILFQQLYAHLTQEERHLVKARQGGLSMEDIALQQRTSLLSVSTTWRRVKRKLYSVAGHKAMKSRS